MFLWSCAQDMRVGPVLEPFRGISTCLDNYTIWGIWPTKVSRSKNYIHVIGAEGMWNFTILLFEGFTENGVLISPD